MARSISASSCLIPDACQVEEVFEIEANAGDTYHYDGGTGTCTMQTANERTEHYELGAEITDDVPRLQLGIEM